MGFNPCFAGFPFRTKLNYKYYPSPEEFQSLFCWISLSDKDTLASIGNAFTGFQSLFCWISLSDYPRSNGLRICFGNCFNPCFAGFPFRTRLSWSIKMSAFWFQSLFCWISLSDWSTSNGDSGSFKEFQSLFCWISLSDLQYNHQTQRLQQFQSLFCWISLSDYCNEIEQIILTPVSILVLLDFPFGRGMTVLSCIRNLFQSLFCWISLSD